MLLQQIRRVKKLFKFFVLRFFIGIQPFNVKQPFMPNHLLQMIIMLIVCCNYKIIKNRCCQKPGTLLNRYYVPALFIVVILFSSFSARAQADTLLDTKSLRIQSIEKIDKNIRSIDEKIEKKTIKILAGLQKQETKLKSKLALKDSVAAKDLFPENNSYKAMSAALKNATAAKSLNEYIPQLDSLKTGLKFLDQAKSLQDKFPKEWTAKIAGVNKSVEGLQSKLQQANEVRSFIKERRQMLKEQLQKYGMAKELKKINKEVYYYQQQINEYKELLKDRKKMEQKLLQL